MLVMTVNVLKREIVHTFIFAFVGLRQKNKKSTGSQSFCNGL